jgi:hypothetical protein
LRPPTKDDEVGLLGGSECGAAQTVLQGGGHGVDTVVEGAPAAVALRIDDALAKLLLQRLQRRHVVFCLQFRRAAALRERAGGVLAHHQYAAISSCLQRQNLSVVLQQHNALRTHRAAGCVVFLRAHRPDGLGGIHGRAEDGA